MATANCALNGYSFFNNGWGGTDKTPYTDNSTSHACWGYDSNGRLRWMVLGFTTPDVIGIDKQIIFSFQAFNEVKNPTLIYKISTQKANYVGTDGGGKNATVPTDIAVEGSSQVTLAANTYAVVTLEVDAENLEPNTTYYLWTTTESWSAGYCGYYASSTAPWTAVIDYTPGTVYIDNGTKFVPAIPYIDNGTKWVQAIPYMDNGSKWVIA